MNNDRKIFTAALLLAAAVLFAPQRSGAQGKDDMKQEPKHDRKYVVRLLTIEDGDTTVADHAVEPDEELTWVDDDGTELTAVFEAEDDDDADMREDMTVEVLGKEKYKEYMLGSGKDGKPMKIFIGKKRAGGHGDMDCCDGGSCCRMGHMDMKEMHGMHGKMDEKMERMHGKMDEKMERMDGKMKEKMERMHDRMDKKLRKMDDDDDDDRADDDSDDDDDDGGLNPIL